MRTMLRRVAIGWTAALVAACGCPCDPGAEARELAGSGAIDCGFVPLGDDPTSALACAEGAIGGGGAFYVGFQRMGTDSDVRTYLAGSADGTIWILGYDGDPSGGSGACATLSAWECLDTPSRFTGFDGTTQLTCATSREGGLALCGR